MVKDDWTTTGESGIRARNRQVLILYTRKEQKLPQLENHPSMHQFSNLLFLTIFFWC